MTKASIDGGGVEQSSNPSTPSTEVTEQSSPTMGGGEAQLSAPRGLGDSHPLERALEQLRDFRAHIASRMVLSRVDAPIQTSSSIPISPAIPVTGNYTTPVSPIHPIPVSTPQIASTQPSIRETTSSEPTGLLGRKDHPPTLSKTEAKEPSTKDQLQSRSETNLKADTTSQTEKTLEKRVEQKVDAPPNDPVQALEKALDSILKGYSSTQAPSAQTESLLKVTPHTDVKSSETTQPAKEQPRTTPTEPHPSQNPASHRALEPQQTTATAPVSTTSTDLPQLRVNNYISQQSSAELVVPLPQPLDPSKPDGQTTNKQHPPEQEQRRHTERSEQQHHQHAEQLQLAQQIVAAYLEQTALVRAQNAAEQLPPSIQPRHEYTTVAVEKVRESVLDKLTAIQSQLETSSTERKRSEQIKPEQNTSIQGRDQLIRQAPIYHDLKPSLDVLYNERSSSSSQLAKILREITPTLATFVAPAAMTSAQGLTPTSIIGARSSLDSLNGLFDLLKRFSERSKNVQLVARMDSPLEKACLSLVTGVALGVVGVEMMIRTANLALAEMLRALRESQKLNETPEDEQKLHEELDSELEAYIHQTFIEPIQAGVVADVSGNIIDSQSKVPIAGVLIGSRELGSTISDDQGRFLFKNVALGTGYTLTFYQPLFNLMPRQLSGVCSERSHHTIELMRVTITPKASP